MKKHLGLVAAGLLSVSVPASADIFFSEYIEGSSFNKALEIYNSSDIELDLADYSIQVFFNGNTVSSASVDLVGTIAPEGVFVISHPSASEEILALADQTSGSINFNGDDAIQLVLTESAIVADSIGQIGFDPGSEWGVDDV